MIFGEVDDAMYLYGLYRDDHIRMWSVKSGQCVSIVNCVPNALETRARGCMFRFPSNFFYSNVFFTNRILYFEQLVTVY